MLVICLASQTYAHPVWFSISALRCERCKWHVYFSSQLVSPNPQHWSLPHISLLIDLYMLQLLHHCGLTSRADRNLQYKEKRSATSSLRVRTSNKLELGCLWLKMWNGSSLLNFMTVLYNLHHAQKSSSQTLLKEAMLFTVFFSNC